MLHAEKDDDDEKRKQEISKYYEFMQMLCPYYYVDISVRPHSVCLEMNILLFFFFASFFLVRSWQPFEIGEQNSSNGKSSTANTKKKQISFTSLHFMFIYKYFESSCFLFISILIFPNTLDWSSGHCFLLFLIAFVLYSKCFSWIWFSQSGKNVIRKVGNNCFILCITVTHNGFNDCHLIVIHFTGENTTHKRISIVINEFRIYEFQTETEPTWIKSNQTKQNNRHHTKNTIDLGDRTGKLILNFRLIFIFVRSLNKQNIFFFFLLIIIWVFFLFVFFFLIWFICETKDETWCSRL